MLVINLPIEPIESRYSIQWAQWFEEGFTQSGLSFLTINGTEGIGEIRTGAFLDVIGTNLYKISQLRELVKFLSVQPKDSEIVLFFHDLWSPGLTNLAYLRDGLGMKNLKITGCLHAGSYDKYDFLSRKGMQRWALPFEKAMLEIVDEVFVATDFHKDLIMENFCIPSEKISITGFPIRRLKAADLDRDIDFVLPHRLDEEKNPGDFHALPEEIPGVFIKTKEHSSNRDEYLRLLNRSKIAVSFANQETWGIAMQEAVFMGCIPLVPDRLAYKEMYHPVFRYTSWSDLLWTIKAIQDRPKELSLIHI